MNRFLRTKAVPAVAICNSRTQPTALAAGSASPGCRQSRRLAAMCALILLSGQAFGQTGSGSPAADQGGTRGMSVAELEEFVAREKRELETVIENRESALQEQAAIREKLQKQQARQRQLEEQLREVCEQHNRVNPGEPIDCEKELGSS